MLPDDIERVERSGYVPCSTIIATPLHRSSRPDLLLLASLPLFVFAIEQTRALAIISLSIFPPFSLEHALVATKDFLGIVFTQQHHGYHQRSFL